MKNLGNSSTTDVSASALIDWYWAYGEARTGSGQLPSDWILRAYELVSAPGSAKSGKTFFSGAGCRQFLHAIRERFCRDEHGSPSQTAALLNQAADALPRFELTIQIDASSTSSKPSLRLISLRDLLCETFAASSSLQEEPLSALLDKIDMQLSGEQNLIKPDRQAVELVSAFGRRWTWSFRSTAIQMETRWTEDIRPKLACDGQFLSSPGAAIELFSRSLLANDAETTDVLMRRLEDLRGLKCGLDCAGERWSSARISHRRLSLQHRVRKPQKRPG